MTTSKPPSTIPTGEYEAIEEALLESARGRWFLDEFSRRNRSQDTQVLLDAIERLGTTIATPTTGANSELIRRDLIEMSEAISRTRQEIAAIKPPDETDSQIFTATEELDAIVEATEKATSDILEAAEEIQEAGWLLRETGEHGDICDKLDQRATDIYMACSFQDITGQRTDKVVQALRFLEARINSMMEIWQLGEVAPAAKLEIEDSRPDAHLLNGPQLDGSALEQNDIDAMIVEDNGDFDVIDHDDFPTASQTSDNAASLNENSSAGEPMAEADIDDMDFDSVMEPDSADDNPDAILFSSDDFEDDIVMEAPQASQDSEPMALDIAPDPLPESELAPEPEPELQSESELADSELAEAKLAEVERALEELLTPEAELAPEADLAPESIAGLELEADDNAEQSEKTDAEALDESERILAEAVAAISKASARIEVRPAMDDVTNPMMDAVSAIAEEVAETDATPTENELIAEQASAAEDLDWGKSNALFS